MAEWYYIGHYGQLGPLTLEQMEELIEAGVVQGDTYVWRTGMSQWQFGKSVPEIASIMARHQVGRPPEPPPSPSPLSTPSAPPRPYEIPSIPAPYSAPSAPIAPSFPSYPSVPGYYEPAISPYGEVMSDRSRLAAGILQLVLPGVGRMYLGYAAQGVLQLILCFCSGGLLWIWSLIDGILILTGSVKLDGYGRRLRD
ncbi:MAG: DUF4339 domain-containing protein [Fimbriimonadaceae bacterium]|nr:DUF4339 domain-containing protein [Fimbriimonadaceae bacterium]